MKKILIILGIVVGLMVLAIFSGVVYTLNESKQAIITEFGKPIGDPVTEAGLHFKTPFIQEVNYIEKRILEWDGNPREMPTKDKTYIIVDTFGRWEISDAMQYFKRLRDERSAQSRLDDILGSETRNAIANHELIEVIRSTKGRTPESDSILSSAPGNIGQLYAIKVGRTKIEESIYKEASAKLEEFGINLLDVRFKRINYNESVRERIYDRMISERQQIASLFRSEGEGEAAIINGRKEKDLQMIQSEAYKEVERIRGKADAEATEIYAGAYNQNRQAVEFYEFTKALETYERMLNEDTTLILSTDSDVYKYLRSIDGQ